MLAILITLDCAREDHAIGPRALTPCLDAFRGEAVTFSSAYAHTNTTLPSHVTMMTGALMPEHLMVDNHSVPSKEHLLLTETLTGMGVTCAGFVGIQFLEKLYASKIGRPDPFYNLPSSRLGKKLLQRLGLRGTRRGAAPTADGALRWVRASGTGDAFCWLHLFDTHMDYRAAERWRRHYGVPETPSPRPLDETLRAEGLVSYHPVQGERRPLEFFPSLYRASISCTDEVLGHFFADLKAMGRYDDALIVVTADHGENLLEHGVYCSHPLLFEETIRVPLMVKFPGKLHSGVEVSAPVGHQDLMPTILRHFGAERCTPRCRDLAGYLGSLSGDGERTLLAFHNKMIQACVRRGPWLYIKNLDLERVGPQNRGLYDSVGLFDLSGGRAENPAVEAEMAGLLQAYLDEAKLVYPPSRPEEADIKEKLEGLGYL